jgi:hypothetical protein
MRFVQAVSSRFGVATRPTLSWARSGARVLSRQLFRCASAASCGRALILAGRNFVHESGASGYHSVVYEIVNAVGKLVEIRLWSPVTAEEAAAWAKDHDRVVTAVGGPYVCLADLIDAKVFPEDAVDAYTAVMKAEPLLLRTGTLLSYSPTSALQVRRMLRETNNPVRGAFTEALSLLEWLDPVLTPLERKRLREVLTERDRL